MLLNKKIQLQVNLDFKLENLFAILVSIEVILLLIDSLVSCCGFVSHSKLQDLLDITLEANIPTWFSSTQAIMTGLVAILIARIRSPDDRKKALGWYLTGAFFVYLGIDDAAQIHERVSTFMNDVIKNADDETLLSGVLKIFPSYHWQIFFLPVFAIIGVLMMGFIFFELRGKKALPVFIAAMACYVVAVGLDYVDGVSQYYDFVLQYTSISFDELEHISRAIEEFLEMLGTTLFMMSFLLVLDSSRPVVVD